jgi:hypothetical protein
MHIWVGKEGFNANEYDVYLDGVKQEYVFEASEELGKLWKNIKLSDGTFKTVGMSEELDYVMLTGKVEIRKNTVPQNNTSSYSGNQYPGIFTCADPACIYCNGSGGIDLTAYTMKADHIDIGIEDNTMLVNIEVAQDGTMTMIKVLKEAC